MGSAAPSQGNYRVLSRELQFLSRDSFFNEKVYLVFIVFGDFNSFSYCFPFFFFFDVSECCCLIVFPSFLFVLIVFPSFFFSQFCSRKAILGTQRCRWRQCRISMKVMLGDLFFFNDFPSTGPDGDHFFDFPEATANEGQATANDQQAIAKMVDDDECMSDINVRYKCQI